MALPSNPVTFDQVIAALLDEQHPFPATYLHSFSDISTKDLLTLKEVWDKVKADRRVSLLEDLEDIADAGIAAGSKNASLLRPGRLRD